MRACAGENTEMKLDIRDELIFQPVIPGVTFPISDVGVYGLSLFLSTVFHELGHALAADCQDVKILGYKNSFMSNLYLLKIRRESFSCESCYDTNQKSL